MTEQAELLDRSVLTNQGKKLVGDSLFYDMDGCLSGNYMAEKH